MAIVPGSIDLNIMTKLDRTNYGTDGEPLPQEFSDAQSAFRGFANSTVQSSVVFSAGMNMRLFSYMEQFPGFIPDNEGNLSKKIVIKVRDYHSALVQGKILANWLKRGFGCRSSVLSPGVAVGFVRSTHSIKYKLLQLRASMTLA